MLPGIQIVYQDNIIDLHIRLKAKLFTHQRKIVLVKLSKVLFIL